MLQIIWLFWDQEVKEVKILFPGVGQKPFENPSYKGLGP